MKELCIVLYLTLGVVIVLPIVFLLYIIGQLGSMCFSISEKSKYIVFSYERGMKYLKK